MNILYESSIPHGGEYFSALGQARSFETGALSPADLANVEYLAVRSTTVVNAALLQEAKQLKMVATATAGTNHLDIPYLESANIAWRDAGGCNAIAVAEYVVSILLKASVEDKIQLDRITVGIVGAGHVGTTLSRLLEALNISYVLNDPPREEAGDSRNFVALEEIMACDVISLHIPFTREGAHPTAGLIGARQLAGLSAHQLFINACRGEVVDEQALAQRLQQKPAPTAVLDVFMNEPAIDTRLLDFLWFATGHIAGHSIEGKLRGTQLVYEAFCEAAAQPVALQMEDFLAAPMPFDFTPRDPSVEALSFAELAQLLLGIYDIAEDDRLFRQMMAESNQFTAFRKGYRVRREYNAYTLRLSGVVSEGILRQLTGLGFTLETL
ncbi:4-phosphoerythronate dehydrogenase [Salinimonas marina]|uniref:Erythronate-4-phosphate dehydrogenase n=1 Tax=Salinimonas marina TaxID=2785918 RepID=A0A7S9HDW0_9ALTE|nr:4-phosphoerythronate dehydrogenase [Salinimonas marina]QPG06681.1 4-phosphoerythronate dehydrogenase [Salinimonas marina]